ncbi:60S ribosomal protein L18A [Cichlidogyrus casuarinus]|uniref:60S ribosomal protein L18a n=1 Tax=Cichlidogyrus casuarinus TaxID=1844966 RepID=A0ABD2Q9L1_9PLAT
MRASGELKLYIVVGRKRPTEKEPEPTPYRMRIYAPDSVTAKSRYWYFIRRLKKMKKGSGEIISCERVSFYLVFSNLYSKKHPRKSNMVHNFGVWIRYDSRSGTHNMYKEFRDVSEEAAVTMMYREMGGKHRARATSIHVIKVEKLPASKCRRPYVTQFHDSKLKFPLPHRVNGNYHKARFTTRKPTTCFV